jgi:hypothetical protein
MTVMWCEVESNLTTTRSQLRATHGRSPIYLSAALHKLPLWRVKTVMWCEVESSRATLQSHLYVKHVHSPVNPSTASSKLSLWRVTWCEVEASRATFLSDLAMPDTTAIHRPDVPFECAVIHVAILLVFICTHM